MTRIPEAHRPTRIAPTTHAVVQGEREWFCTARDPRCAFTTRHASDAIRHAVAGQYPAQHLPPVDVPERVA